VTTALQRISKGSDGRYENIRYSSAGMHDAMIYPCEISQYRTLPKFFIVGNMPRAMHREGG